ncbi:hypothetical protein M427DRAFT_58836 [Gonapodya prolifera JEL478]|uniref:RING-type domain-containing protein n=1 Tax=Gonapodya prolifera (strain JEL478) TaxID=1344416 RepID=A0A139A921_GONPJ|nr:hypothetical protein M427DRAFT_58836 [Gonapodya prolifera JEL478]|eukprot:KXS13312.1 hypothetical protein M427DRAFT_58836 [Gonapodya prolifera JEL478]
MEVVSAVVTGIVQTIGAVLSAALAVVYRIATTYAWMASFAGPVLLFLIRIVAWIIHIVLLSLLYWLTTLYWIVRAGIAWFNTGILRSDCSKCVLLIEVVAYVAITTLSVRVAWEFLRSLSSRAMNTRNLDGRFDEPLPPVDLGIEDEEVLPDAWSSVPQQSTAEPSVYVPNDLAYAVADIADCTPSTARAVLSKMYADNGTYLLTGPVDVILAAAAAELSSQCGKDSTSEAQKGETCIICWDRSRTAVFAPCGHHAACVECSKELTLCPVCRTKVRSVVRYFRP